MSDALLRTEGLALRAGARALASGIEFTVRRGEFWCLLGPNGAGKTTLLHALVGLAPAAAGRIELAGRPLAAWTPAQAALQRGFLPQQTSCEFSVSALELALLGRYPHVGRWRAHDAEDVAIALDALACVDLAGQASRDVTTLSGGERQRAMIAALLAQEPALYLLDEPLAHLDLGHQVKILELLRRLTQRDARAVMLSLHDPALALRFATHAILLGGAGAAPVQGPAAAVLTEQALSATFGHRLRRLAQGDVVAFAPD